MVGPTIELLVGFVALFAGGGYLVKGASALATLARVSVTVVALTVVSMGTSMPELAVSLDAALRGSTDIAFANVIGSNIFNVGAILSLAALLSIIPVRQQTLRIEYPIMFAVSLLAIVFAHDRLVSRTEGVVLVTLLFAFVVYMIMIARSPETGSASATSGEGDQPARQQPRARAMDWAKNVGLVVFGIAVLVLGADFTVAGSIELARLIGVEERVIGLTVVAMGTSLPELATSLVAARRGEQEIALGNVVGSNIFNLLGILGVTAVVVPVPVHARAIALDNWVMLGFSAILLPLMLWRRRAVGRAESAVLLTGFVAYIGYLIVKG